MTETVFTTLMTNHPALTEAYHAIFDAKDKLPDGSTKYLAYEAAAKVAELMHALGFEPPKRFDNEGRNDFTTEPPYLTLSEVDAVEVFAALNIAAQVAAVMGDKVVEYHYQGLNDKLSNQAQAR